MQKVLSGILKGKTQASHFYHKSHRVGNKISTAYTSKGNSMSSLNSTPRDEHGRRLSREKSLMGQLKQLEPTHHEEISLRKTPHNLRKRLHPRGLILGGTSSMVPPRARMKELEVEMQDLRRKIAFATQEDLNDDEEFDEESPLSREIKIEPIPPNFKESRMTA
uniref:Uncharacterized protein n=1 Tax=Cannabis sativa TaxID=3483 RepID=A0A803PZN0_CANSA